MGDYGHLHGLQVSPSKNVQMGLGQVGTIGKQGEEMFGTGVHERASSQASEADPKVQVA